MNCRKLHTRYIMNCELTTQSALHVGGVEAGLEDMTIAINGEGEPYIPGTGIAGALRSWLRENGVSIHEWFGYPNKNNNIASSFIIDNAIINLPKDKSIVVRDQVGIDRNWGTAADKSKFDMAIVPRGLKISINITVDTKNKDESENCKEILGMLYTALSNGLIRFGACKTRGMGKVKAENIHIKKYDLSTKDEMLNYLIGKEAEEINCESKLNQPIKITINWKPKGPMMVKAGYDGLAVDTFPMAESIGDSNIALLLPGSSIKGALRTRAEKIMRTLLDLNPIGDFNEQVKVPVVDVLFGSAKTKKK